MSLLRQAPLRGTRSAALQRIRAALPTLTPAEQRVAERILANPGEAIALSIGEMAQACGVAQPTVSRFARSVGFDGYPAVRLDIAHDFANDSEPAATGHRSDPAAQIALDAAIPAVATALRTAAAVEIWTTPDLAFAGELLETSLRELSVPASTSAIPSHWPRRAAGLPPQSAVLLLSSDAEHIAWSQAPAAARAAGATLISVTQRSTRTQNRQVDILLTIPETDTVEGAALAAVEAVTAAVREASLFAGPPGPASPWRGWPNQREVMIPTPGDPLPVVVLQQADESPDRGVCIFFNGMGTTKEEALPGGNGDRIAPSIVAGLLNCGYHVVVVDNPAHGVRKRVWEDTTELLTADFARDQPVLLGQSRELATALVDGVLALGLTADAGRIAVVGQSWGGLQSILSMCGDQRIACGVMIMPVCDASNLGSFQGLADEPGAAAGRVGPDEVAILAPRPVLLVSGADDEIATDADAAAFARDLAGAYSRRKAKTKLQHVTLEGVGHVFDARQVDHAAHWLATHLPA
ncbi:RpiR family transcriptional regulator [Kribbella rubisoli]|uniref:RpiR family transcriptional regulator n=1 Tax=Kribbella rubisoli TaxID=3075929 RepID=A0A4Q7X167_9ACTN|nr:alpha/beta fold hydrolase [Kribbella rubisoli]RZU15829.1 RpiR family transcriptional regulator [Kribbella rubisoli]